MVVDRSSRRCLLCDRPFTGRAFVCRDCAERYRGKQIPDEVLRTFYRRVDEEYPEWANTFGNYNPPRALIDYLLSMPRDSAILEIGAGGGYLLHELQQHGFLNLTGSDITPTAITEIARRGSAIRSVGADAESLPFHESSFDAVISSDVVEHLTRVDVHLAEVARVLKARGVYLVKTPNRRPAELFYRLRGLYDHHIWHPSMFSPAEIRTAMDAHGLTAEFLPVSQLTDAQIRKVPTRLGKAIARRLPVRWLPVGARPHLELVARRR